MKRSAPLPRGKALTRTVGLNPRNSKKRARSKRRNFGDEAEAVRAMPCLIAHPTLGEWSCRGPVQAAHVTARGSGGAKGGRFDLVPLCAHHHREAGEANRPGETGETQRDRFEARYRLDLRLEADRIALEHPGSLGLIPLALQWHARLLVGKPVDIGPYERSALLGWTRRTMERSPATTRMGWTWAVRDTLRIVGELTAWDICDAAGWPEVQRG